MYHDSVLILSGNADIFVDSPDIMPVQKSYKIAMIALVAILLVSATVLRFIPAEDSETLNLPATTDQNVSSQELTDESFPAILNSSSLFVLDFYYPGCGPCRFLNNTTAELSRELGGQVLFGRMNARSEENSNTVRDYKVSSFPTLLFFQEGVMVSSMKGNISKSELLAELKDLKPELDTSNVIIPAVPPAGSKASQASGEGEEKTGSATADRAAGQQNQGTIIPLTEPGAKNPSQALLLTDATIDRAIAQHQTMLVVVGFTNPCPYCELFNVTISELAGELNGQMTLAFIDTRPNIQTREKYNITGIPATLIFKNGEFSGIVQGNKNKATIVAKLKEIEPGLNLSNVSLPLSQLKLTPEEACVKMNKSNQPLLQAFVVSRCPFGLQMQRIMADIISEAEETEEFMKVMYIGAVDAENNTILAMHGEVEAQENLRQICIREEQPDRYWDYVRCYMKEGKTAECLESVSIDIKELDACTNDSARGLAYAQEDFDLANRFQVTGSPTMLMNGEVVRESHFATNSTNARSPEAVKELLCCGFNEQPAFCSMELNQSRAETMFSDR